MFRFLPGPVKAVAVEFSAQLLIRVCQN